ncbi:LysM peptidoglycan-binding domain-containing protein, partial [Deinococcus sp.]|uniref:LysM peptidoglycan-binding domain-containing protein n=1 Tax=Deinococcus sp. TaxID=47478 RepID=UPI00286DFA46
MQTSAVQTYTVRPGDTAYSVARLAGTDVPTLLRLNNLTSADLRPVTLKPGQVLKLPAGPPQPAPAQPASVQPAPSRPAPSRPAAAQAAPPRSHTVQPGQTLYSVARLYGLKTGEVQEFNRLSSAELKPGQVLMLPAGVQGVQASPAVGPAPVAVAAPSRPAPPRPTPPRPAAMSPAPLLGVQLPSAVPPRHTVQPGQTLYAVARLYNLRADDLLALNQLTSSDLRAGQVLLLPAGVTVQPAASSSMLPGVADSPSAVPGRTIFSPGVPLPVMLPVPLTPNLPTPGSPTPGSPRSELSPP